MRRSLLLIPALVIPLTVHAWWNDDWSAAKTLTLDTGAAALDIKATVADAPVLVRLHSGNFADFLAVADDGKDLRFIGPDGTTVLPHQVEQWDAVNEIGLVWVRMPQLQPGAAKMEMYYGNAAATDAGDAAALFDGNTVLAYHFSEPDGAIRDQTAKANNPSQSSAEHVNASLIGGGARFTGASRIEVPAASTLGLIPESGYTASLWLKLDGEQKDAYVLDLRDGGQSLILAVDGAAPYAAVVAGGKTYATAKGATLSPGSWHHLAMVVKGSRLELFLDGSSVGVAEGAIAAMNPALVVGAGPGGGNSLKAEMDELQIANIARTPEWLRVAARSQSPDSQYLQVGEPGATADAGKSHSYFATILQSVTLDGWVVIGFLAVMGLVSWIVMVAKAGMLRRTESENSEFLDRFRKLPPDHFTDLADKDARWLATVAEENAQASRAGGALSKFRGLLGVQARAGSPLAELYALGVHELKRRLSPSIGAAGRLPRASIDAIRATLDGAMVRETQRLNGKMVLLTIAIAGGPFLGLLGTVVGVMITFAAIAATGDVNINAIAPGIAAALVATVAGLAVAIPALFGYNWLGSRIKDQVADMHVFVDELVTRLSEEYSA
jgi:biopolymer transport protein ExbB